MNRFYSLISKNFKMGKFRNSKIAKAICLFVAVAIFNLSCTDYEQTVECTTVFPDFNNSQDIPDRFENALEMIRAIGYQQSPESISDYYGNLTTNSDQISEYTTVFEQESDKYIELGFEDYIDDLYSREMISSNLKSKFINFGTSITNFIDTASPDLTSFTNFIQTEKSTIDESGLCAKDKKAYSIYLDLVQGYGQYMYEHYYSASEFNNLDPRSCGFFEAIGCGILSLIVGIAVTAFVIIIITGSFFTVNGNEVTGQDKEDFALLAGLALGLTAGVNFYDWCCGKDEIPTQTCSPPTNHYYIEKPCGTYTYTVWGKSKYSSTDWLNTNATPATATTSTPTLQLQVITYGQPSTLRCTTACVSSGTSVQFYIYTQTITFVAASADFSISWNQSPPSTFHFTSRKDANFIDISVNGPDQGVYKYTWSINSPHGITGRKEAEIWIRSNSDANISLTVLNTCTNTSRTLNATIDVY